MAQKVVLLQLILYGEHNMNKEKKIKVYTYTRVSTAMQVDGYSLDAQTVSYTHLTLPTNSLV